MTSVTQRIKQIKQPYGGYLNPNDFEKKKIIDDKILMEENIHSSLVGLAVDYLTRFMLGAALTRAFNISLIGARIIDDEKRAYRLLRSIKGLDDLSIYNACKLVGYDVCYRTGPLWYKNINEIKADKNTINNIRIMVERSILFFKKYGPIIKDGFTFEGGYTKTISAGDGDFLTADTLWDFKVSKSEPTSANTLQLLIYYIMGKHSIYTEFMQIKKIGIFNPRVNCIYLKEISTISSDILYEVSTKIIGYDESYETVKPQNKVSLRDTDMIPMEKIMKMLSCSRYMVMKYYSQEGLPLVKIKNRYFIDKFMLDDWLMYMDEGRNWQKIVLIFAVLLILAQMLILIGVFK